jgi:hypothetical protein
MELRNHQLMNIHESYNQLNHFALKNLLQVLYQSLFTPNVG